jgi:hypothetical protein
MNNQKVPESNESDGGWYLADLVVEITVGNQPLRAVHVNSVLVSAPDADEAYRLSIALGREYDAEDRNPAGEAVTIRFVGLKELSYIDTDLEHGTEISYKEAFHPLDGEFPLPIRLREELDVFLAPHSSIKKPIDYSSGRIVAEAITLITARKRDSGGSGAS